MGHGSLFGRSERDGGLPGYDTSMIRVGSPVRASERKGKPDFASIDFDRSPYIVIWEVTQACDLACRHCRAEARPWRDPFELTTEEGFRLIDQIREFGHPLFVITGGDPLKRPDLFDLIRYADGKGLRVALTPSGTRWMTEENIQRMKDAGLTRLAVSLDGSTKEIHDAFRRVEGSFGWTIDAIRTARRIGLPVQINTSVSRHNLDDIRPIADLLATLDICLWSVFFLVPTGRGKLDEMISADDHEKVFHLLYDLSKEMPYDLKTTAAQHFRRVVVQRRRIEEEARSGVPDRGGSGRGAARRAPAPSGAALAEPEDRMSGGGAGPMEPGGWLAGERREAQPVFLTEKSPADADASEGIGRAAKGVNDGNGFVFISHRGEACPSGFLPVSAGNVRRTSLVDLYRDAPLFREIRDYTKLLGKCGWCDYREVCGGSRSRAYGVTGNYMASETYCAYEPPKPERRAVAGSGGVL